MASLLLFLVATLTEVYRNPTEQTIIPDQTERMAEDTVIIPGTRIGVFTLGLPISHLTRLFGQGTQRPHGKGVVHLYEEVGIVVYSESDLITSVTVRSPEFQTRQGVGVGVDVDKVLKTLGKSDEVEGDERSYVMHNWSEGWHVGVEGAKVTYVQVTSPLQD